MDEICGVCPGCDLSVTVFDIVHEIGGSEDGVVHVCRCRVCGGTVPCSEWQARQGELRRIRLLRMKKEVRND